MPCTASAQHNDCCELKRDIDFDIIITKKGGDLTFTHVAYGSCDLPQLAAKLAIERIGFANVLAGTAIKQPERCLEQ